LHAKSAEKTLYIDDDDLLPSERPAPPRQAPPPPPGRHVEKTVSMSVEVVVDPEAGEQVRERDDD
jgi:hypothetical protein